MQLLTIRAAGFSATVDACARDDGQIWFLSLLGNQQSVRAPLGPPGVKGETAYLSEDELGGGSPCWLASEAWHVALLLRPPALRRRLPRPAGAGAGGLRVRPARLPAFRPQRGQGAGRYRRMKDRPAGRPSALALTVRPPSQCSGGPSARDSHGAKQVGHLHFKSGSKFLDVQQRDIPLPSFRRRDVGTMKSGAKRKLFLG